KIVGKDDSGEHPLQLAELTPGMLVEAEGQWLDRHRFFPEKLTVDLRQNDKKIRGTAYLQEEPLDAAKIASGDVSQLKVDGYWLALDSATKRAWNVAKAGSGLPAKDSTASAYLAGYHVKYSGSGGKGRPTAPEETQPRPACTRRRLQDASQSRSRPRQRFADRNRRSGISPGQKSRRQNETVGRAQRAGICSPSGRRVNP